MPILPALLDEIVRSAEKNSLGNTANYIPELANFPLEYTTVTVHALGDTPITVANMPAQKMTLQSVSKLIPLIALLEEKGVENVFSWVKVEPSGDDFASVARLDQFGPRPSNPMLNAGAITLCSHIDGEGESRIAWLNHWVKRLFRHNLSINNLVLTSEKRTGDRNRSLAYLLKSQGNIQGEVNEVLEIYFTLCALEAYPEQLAALAWLLANDGKDESGQQVISSDTVKHTLSIMATCGLYNETGTHMVRTGMPAKSGVSGVILAVSPGRGGIVTASPRVNGKGNSIRGSIILERLAAELRWHFADPVMIDAG